MYCGRKSLSQTKCSAVSWNYAWRIGKMHCTENPIYVFPEKELRDLSPNSFIHVSVSDLYILWISTHIWLQLNRQTNPGNIKISHRYMSVGIGRQTLSFCFGNNEAAQFPFWECILGSGNQTFIVDSHRPFICSVHHVLHPMIARLFEGF